MNRFLTIILASTALSFSTGCMTNSAGKRVADIAKIDKIKALADPVAASAIRQALVNSPEHAVKIAPYLNAVAGVFCTMSISNEFSPTYLIDAANKLVDPELAKIGNGAVLDGKELVIAAYKILYGDRLHAEIPPDQWMHKVCEFFCESITQGLINAGYPGGVKQSARVYHSQRLAKLIYQ